MYGMARLSYQLLNLVIYDRARVNLISDLWDDGSSHREESPVVARKAALGEEYVHFLPVEFLKQSPSRTGTL